MPLEPDDLPRPAGVPGLPRVLDPLGLDELAAYRAVLEEEIRRVDAEAEKKRSMRGAASSLFRS